MKTGGEGKPFLDYQITTILASQRNGLGVLPSPQPPPPFPKNFIKGGVL